MSNTDPFSAIADPNRRYLLEELSRGPLTVNELAKGLPISRPAVSQHLKALLDCGLVDVSSKVPADFIQSALMDLSVSIFGSTNFGPSQLDEFHY
jgi:DNA-binding transcriptional ArsR family regulator